MIDRALNIQTGLKAERVVEKIRVVSEQDIMSAQRRVDIDSFTEQSQDSEMKEFNEFLVY